MKVRPLRNKILLRIPSAKEQKSGHIFLPPIVTSLNQNQIEGEVIALGYGKYKNGLQRPITEVKLGDKIIVAKYAGTRLHIDGKLHMIVFEEEIMAVVE